VEEAYKIFLDYLKSCYPSDDINSLTDYLEWIGGFVEINTPLNMADNRFDFYFDAECKKDVLNGALEELKQYSKPEKSKKMFGVDLLLCVEDMDEEIEYIKLFINEDKNIHWFGDKDEELGFFYKSLDLKNEESFIKTVIYLAENMKLHPELENRLNQMESWDGFQSYEEDDEGFGYVDWNELGEYISENLIHFIYDDLKKLLQGFAVLHCGDSFSSLIGGIGESYYVFCGYNATDNIGEAMILRDCCY